MSLTKNDITKLHVDAIVNAANEGLKGGGGVCGSIFRAAGPLQLKKECDRHGGCPTGHAVITSACAMQNVRYIIHAVGPMVQDGIVTEENEHQLNSCYIRSLDMAKKHGVRRIV